VRIHYFKHVADIINSNKDKIRQMKTSSLKDKLIGILGIVFGFACFLPLIAVNRSKLIVNAYDFLGVKYFLVVVFINGGLLFIIFGILIYLGIIIPYYSVGKNKYEKAKHNVILVVLSLPFWISSLIAVFVISRSILVKILWTSVVIYIVSIFFSSIKSLRTGSRSK